MANIYARTILRKLNSRSAAMLIALILASCGSIMIFNQITDVGMIDIKSPILSGKLSTGFVGIFLIFFAVLVVFVNFKKATKTTQEITIKIGEVTVSYKNMPYDKVLELNSLIKDLHCASENTSQLVKTDRAPNKAITADANSRAAD